MVHFKSTALNAILLSGTALLSAAFVQPPSFGITASTQAGETQVFSATTDFEIDERTGKRTGNSFLSEDTKARGAAGNPIEKAKQKKCATSLFVDVYEYAAKIRAGEMDWKDVEKADLDTVSPSISSSLQCHWNLGNYMLFGFLSLY